MAQWNGALPTGLNDLSKMGQYESKLAVAKKLAARAEHNQIIGAGSGSTALLALLELARRDREDALNLRFIPTSIEIEWACLNAGVTITTLNAARPDWCFDGADEVDPNGHMIKGRGGAMYREKLVMSATQSRFILVDTTKFVDHLGQKFAVPVERDAAALALVESALHDIGATDITIRPAGGKDGPVITEQGNIILDVRFDQITAEHERQIAAIPGVLDSGLFWGYTPQILQPSE